MEDDYVRYSAIVDRTPVRWPDGARLALWVCPNVEFYEYLPVRSRYADQWPRTPHPDVMTYSYKHAGNTTGFWRMLEIFDAHDVRATVSLNTAVLEHLPEIRDAMVQRDWDYMSHGVYNTRYLYGMAVDDEREFYRQTSDMVARHTGKTLKGMLGPWLSSTANTPRLMAEAGLIYNTDWLLDDQPFPIKVDVGRLCGVPYSASLNDGAILSSGYGGEHFVEMCKDQFDVLYAEGATSGRVMCIALHPYVIGQPHRVKYLDEIFSYVLSHDKVWVTTADDIAEWYLEHHHAEHLQQLQRSPVT